MRPNLAAASRPSNNTGRQDDRVDALVAEETAAEPFDAGQRGMGDMWRRAERDMAEQELVYADETQEISCIIVEPE